MVEIIYSIFLISSISILWFYTDSIFWYCQLFNIFENFRQEYGIFISKNENNYFPQFLYKQTFKVNNRFVKFLYKLLSCPFCLIFWLSLFASLIISNVLSFGIIYVVSLFIVLGIKKML